MSKLTIDFGAFNFSNTIGTKEKVTVLINGSQYMLTQSNFSNLAFLSTGAPATVTLDASGAITDTSAKDNGGLRGTITIDAASVPGGVINSFGVKDQDINSGAGVVVKFSVPASMGTPSQTVQQLFGGVYSDANADAMAGVVVTSAGTGANVTALGQYQFSKDNGVTWSNLAGGLTDSTSVYLAKTDLVRFVPSASNGSTNAKQDLVVRLVDDSLVSGNFASGATVNLSTTGTGGSTAISGNTVALSVTNTAPVANPTSVVNVFAGTTGPEVTVSDNVSAATAANATDVTFTLRFSEAIKASTLTEADLSVTNGTLKAGTLTQVNATTWTVQATTPTAATSASGGMVLTVAEGSYTNNAGLIGDGNSDVQRYGTSAAPAGDGGNIVSAVGGVPDTDSTSIETLKDGGWIVVWNSSTAGASYAQRYDSTGKKVGNNFTVWAYSSALTMADLADGGFVITGLDYSVAPSAGLYPQKIYRYDANSTLISTTTAGLGSGTASSSGSSIAGLTNGGFVFVNGSDLYVYDSTGAQVGAKSTIATTVLTPWVTKLNSGDFVVTYVNNGDVYAQMYSAAGVKSGGAIVVNTTTTGVQANQSVAELANGGFVVTWSDGSTTGSMLLRRQIFDATGAKVGTETTLATITTTPLWDFNSSVEGLAGGGFAVSWMDGNQNIHVQAFDASGNAVGPDTNLYVGKSQSHPHITALPDGSYVVAYRQVAPDGTDRMYQQIFGAPGSIVTTGTAANTVDTIAGSDLADNIVANGGADKIWTGAGDDKVTINESNVTALSGATAMVIDGGTGVNTLTLTNTSAAATIDLTNATVADRLKNFSSIDLTGTQNNTLKLDWKAVATFSGATDNTATNADESKMLVVSGNAGDAVNLVNLSSWSVGSSQTAASLTSTYGSSYNFLSGHTYKAYTLNGATVFVDDAITLTNLASSTTAYTPVTNALTVQALFGPSFTDVDSGQTFTGVAITSAGTTANVTAGQKYQYSTNGGTTWTDLAGGLTDSTAVFLAPTALIRFADTSGATTAVPSTTLTARLVDSSGLTGTSGLTSGTTVDAHINGGSTAFSGSPVTVSLLNRAPVSSDADGIVVADPLGAAAATVSPAGTTMIIKNATSVTGPSGTVATITGSTNSETFTGVDGLWIGDTTTSTTANLETVNFAFSKPVESITIDFSNFNNRTATTGAGASYASFTLNGQPYKLSLSDIVTLTDPFNTAAGNIKSTAVFSADGLQFQGVSSSSVSGVNGQFKILAPAGSGGISNFSIADYDIQGSIYKLTVSEATLGTPVTQSQTVDALFGQYYTDADNNAFAGVMVSGAGTSAQQSSLGKYQFSKDGGTTWTDLASTASDASATYLLKTDLVRFVPASTNTSSAKPDLTVHLVDSSTANTFVDGSASNDVSGTHSGGSTAVSANTVTLHAPVVSMTGAGVDGSLKTINFGADTTTRIEDPKVYANGVQVTTNVNTTNVDTVETTSVKVEYIDLDALTTTTAQDMRLSMSGMSAMGASATNWILELGRSNSQGTTGTAEIKVSSKIGTFNSATFDYADLQSANAHVDFYDANNNLIVSKTLANRVLDGSGNATKQTFTSGTLPSAASYFKIVANHDTWNLDTLVLGTTTQTLPSGSNTLDSTPILQGTMSEPVTSAQEVQIYDGSTKLGVATLDSAATTWTYSVTTAASAGAHTYTAKLVNKADSSVIATSGVYSLSVNVSPLVLDLNGDGVQTTTLENGTQFDLTNAGTKQSVAWIDKHDGLLVMDLNGDGQVNSGAELFGSSTKLADGTTAKDGWSALAQFDANADGVIDAKDAVFSQLKIWVDSNGDGITEAGELRSLSDAGVKSINLTHDSTQVAQNGNILQGFSSFTTTDGQSHEVVDAWLNVGQTTTPALPSDTFSLSQGQTLDLSQVLGLSQLKAVDMATDTGANTLKLTLNDVLSAASTNGVHKLTVTGDANDTVELDLSHWTNTGATVTDNGHSYAVYNGSANDTAQLLIDQHMLITQHG